MEELANNVFNREGWKRREEILVCATLTMMPPTYPDEQIAQTIQNLSQKRFQEPSLKVHQCLTLTLPLSPP
jgi:hypothetical protein